MTLILAGFVASGSARVALIGAGVVLLVLIPALIQHRLEVLAERVSGATREEALELRKTLKTRPLVSLFAPAAWVTLQEAQLALRLGDGKAAALLYAETARRCRRPDAVMLVSAQAHALVVANDRPAARELLNTLAAAKLLGPRDQLDLGIVMLLDSNKKSRQAMAYLEAARKTIGDHPRVKAAMALGLQRAERVDESAELLEKAQISLQEEPDAVVEVLVHRARREMRRYIEAQLRRERRARSRRATIIVTSEHAVSEIISGEISSRGDSGANAQAEGESGESSAEAAAESAADSEALQARGWQEPGSFSGKAEDAEAKPKVRVELRDTSVGEPIRIEGSYALKTKEAIERERPPERRRRRDPGPAIDIDLSLDEDDDDYDDDDVSLSVETPEVAAVAKPSTETPEAARTEAKEAQASAVEAAPTSDEGEAHAASTTPTSPAERALGDDAAAQGDSLLGTGEPSGIRGGLLESLQVKGDDEAPPPRDEASALRRRGSLTESLVSALGSLETAAPTAAPAAETSAPAAKPEAPAEADAPVAMRRGRTSASPGALPKPPPFPSLGRGLGRSEKLPTFAPPSQQRTESDPSLASFKPEGGQKS